MNGNELEPLNLLDRDEFWDVCKSVRPDITREQFETDWDEFQDLKAQRAARMELN